MTAAERLELRTLLSVTSAVSSGVLTVTLSAANDHADISYASGNISVVDDTTTSSVSWDATANINRIVIVDSGSNLNQRVTFNGTNSINGTGSGVGSLSVATTGIETVDVDQLLSVTSDTGVSGDASVVNVASPGKIQHGVNFSAAGGTVDVGAGTYNELVQVSKTLTLLGAQAGVDARTRSAVPETIISNGDGDIQILANNVKVDGFQLTGVVNAPNLSPYTGLGAAIWTNPGYSGTNGGHQILNNIIDGNISGIELDNTGTLSTKVQYNLIQNNNASGAGSGNGIQVNFGLANAVIDNNTFINNLNGAASLFVGGASINVTNNVADSQIYLASATSGSISGNKITNSSNGGVVLGGGNSSISITNNEINGVAASYGAFRLRDDGPGPNSGLTVTNNKFIGGAGAYGVRPGTGSYTGTLTLTDNQISGGLAAVQNDDAALVIDTSMNYWGTSNAVTVAASILGAGAANVDFTPVIDNGDTSASVGFQADHSSLSVHTLGAQTGSTGRIQEGVNIVDTSGTVNVANGTFAENVNANKAVTVLGAGSSVAGTIISAASGNVVTIAANSVTLEALRVSSSGSTNGIYFNSAVANDTLTDVVSTGHTYALEIHNSAVVSNLHLNQVSLIGSVNGLRVATTGSVSGLVVVDGHFDNNDYGWQINANSSSTTNQNDFTNIQVSGTTTFNTNKYKGLYAEKLDNSQFTGIAVSGSGYGTTSPTGINLNLKYGNYTGITFSGATVTNSGTGTATAAGVAISGRNDSSYSSNPASLSNLTLTNLTVTGSPIDLVISNNVSSVTMSGVQFQGTGLGLLVYGSAQGDPGNLNLGDASFAGTLAGYLINSASTTTVDGTAATYAGVSGGTSLTTAQAFVIADKIVDNVDVATYGKVVLKTGNVYVTPNSFYSPTTTSPSIQRGIDAASAGGTVNVAAGTYVGNPTVNKAVTLLGANAGTAGGASRVAESIVVTNGNQNAVFTVTSSNATIRGFKIEGDDTGVTLGTLSSGEDANVSYGVRATGALSNLTIQDNIITHAWIGFRGDGPTSGTGVFGSAIADNWFDSIGAYDFGYAVSLRTNFYADVTGNKMTRVHSGLQTNNFSLAGPAQWLFQNNTVQAYAAGAWYNLTYSSAVSPSIDGNTFTTATAPNTVSGFAQFDGKSIGIMVVTLQDSVGVGITNNNISGMAYGVTLYNTVTTNTPTIGNTNTINNNGVGVYLTDIMGFNPVGTTVIGGTANNPNGTGTAILDGISAAHFSGNTTGVLVRGTNTNSPNGATLTLSNGTSISGGTTGLQLDGANAKLSGNTLGSTVFSGQSGDYVTLSNSAYNGPVEVDGTSASYGGVSGGSSLTTAQAYTIEDKISDYLDTGTAGSANLGFVRLRSNTAPVVSSHPSDTNVTAGASANFSAAASGYLSPTVQWQVSTNGTDWSDLSGAISTTYSFTTSVADNGKQFRAIFTNSAGSVTTSVATLTAVGRSMSVQTTYTTTAFKGLNTGTINLVDVLDALALSLPTTYTATVNWGDGQIDSNITVAHPNADGTSVRVLAAHTYAIGGTYRPLITLVDAAGASFTTITANTATLIVGSDVSNKVSITRSSPVKNLITGLWAQTVTINNISGINLTGNLDFVLIGLTAGVTLANKTGSTTGGANPYVRFSSTGLKAGKSISLVLNFALPNPVTTFSYSFKTFLN